jgi:hypothetical protein
LAITIGVVASADDPESSDGVAASGDQTRLEASREECGLLVSAGARLGDDGHTLALNMRGEDDYTNSNAQLPMADIICVLTALDMPDSTFDLMSQTRSLDGIQSDNWDGLEASWSYHPDSGLDIVLTEE